MRSDARISRDRHPRHGFCQRGPRYGFRQLGQRGTAPQEQRSRHDEQSRQLHGVRCLLAAAIVAALPGVASAQSQLPLSPIASPPAPTPTASGQKVRISLAEAVALSLRDNHTIQSAYLQRVAQRFDLVVAESRFWPKLNIATSIAKTRARGLDGTTSALSPVATWLAPTGAQVQFAWTREEGRSGGIATGSEIGSLTVTQPLLRGGGTDVNLAPVRVARLQEQINHLTLKSTVSNTVTSIVLAYRALQQAQAQLRLAEDARDRSNSLLETNRAMISAGRMAAADLIQTEADIATQDVSVLQAEQARNSAQLALLQLMAVDLHTNVLADDTSKPVHVTVPLKRVITLGLDNRMDLLAQRKAVEQTRQNLIIARNNRLWDLSVVGTVQKERLLGQATPAGIGPATDSSVGLQLSIPVGDYTRPQAEIQATTSVRMAEVQLADLKQQVEAAIRDAVQGVELSWRQLVASRRAQTLAESALDVAKQKLQAGRTSNFEVLSYEASLRVGEAQALTAAVSYLNALTSLDQQLGTTLDTWHIALND